MHTYRTGGGAIRPRWEVVGECVASWLAERRAGKQMGNRAA